MIYEFPDVATPVDETQFLAISDSANAEDQKISVSDLLAPADTRRADADDDIITGLGTDAGTGLFTPDDTSNYLKTTDFAAAALQANAYNALLLLDSKLKLTQNIGSQYYTTTLTSSQILNLKATPVLILPTPGAGYFNHVKRMFYKLNFATTAYTVPGAGHFGLFYNTGIDDLCAMPTPFLTGAATEINYNNATGQCEAIVNEAIYLKSTYASELTLGDSTISIIIEYETLADFSVITTPPTTPNCLQPIASTFTNANLTALGNLVITHNLNTTDLMSLVITNNNGSQVAVTSALGDEAGANTLNQITVPIGLGIAGTWSFAIIMNIC